MIRTLVMIAVAGFILSAVCLSLAVGLAGPELVERGAWNSWDWRWKHGHAEMHHEPGAARTLTWSGGEALKIEAPADVTFTQAEGPAKISVRGPRGIVDHLVVENGRIRLSGASVSVDGDRVAIELSAPKITRFETQGDNRLDIRNYSQDKLDLQLSGNAAVTAQGSAKAVAIDVNGQGDADLSGLATEGADVKVSGSGSAKVGPKTWAKVDISGAGDVTLTSHPRRLESHISGSGHIDQDEGSEPDHPATPTKQPAKSV